MKEKRRLLSIAALVLYLLAVCLILAEKIDAQTQNQVTVRPYQLTAKSSGYFAVALTAVFYKELSAEVFEVSEGTGWQNGLRVTLLNPNSYSVDFTPDTRQCQRNAGYVRHQECGSLSPAGGKGADCDGKHTGRHLFAAFRAHLTPL